MKKKKKTSHINTNFIYEHQQLKAMEGKLTGSLVAFERKVRRWYSKEFATPLQDTFKIPWDDILLNYYEASIENTDHNQIFEASIDMLPELAKEREQIDAEFDKELEVEQRKTIKRQKSNDKYRNRVRKAGKLQDLEQEKDGEGAADLPSEKKDATEDIEQGIERIGKAANRIRKAAEKRQSLNKDPSEEHKKAPANMNLKFDDEDPE